MVVLDLLAVLLTITLSSVAASRIKRKVEGAAQNADAGNSLKAFELKGQNRGTRDEMRSSRAKQPEVFDGCCMPLVPDYTSYLSNATGMSINENYGISRMIGFLSHIAIRGHGVDGLLLDEELQLDTEDVFHGVRLMKDMQIDRRLPSFFTEEAQATVLVGKIHALVQLVSNRSYVAVPSGAAGKACGMCFKANVVSESGLIGMLLRISEMYDFNGATRFSHLVPVVNATSRVVSARMEAFQKLGESWHVLEVGAKARELEAGLWSICEKGTSDRLWDEFVYSVDFAFDLGRAISSPGLAQVATQTQSCVKDTRGLMALEQLSTQFIEQLAEGLDKVVQGKTLRALLQERL